MRYKHSITPRKADVVREVVYQVEGVDVGRVVYLGNTSNPAPHKITAGDKGSLIWEKHTTDGERFRFMLTETVGGYLATEHEHNPKHEQYISDIFKPKQ